MNSSTQGIEKFFWLPGFSRPGIFPGKIREFFRQEFQGKSRKFQGIFKISRKKSGKIKEEIKDTQVKSRIKSRKFSSKIHENFKENPVNIREII